ncbi:MAG TPA: glutathionylspermidine synthase family protein [Candidatus Angelobacter sp.]|nr:glutathionylspermidine synthase family protein [Candidatus Angelobacter sp.]
MRRLTVTPRDNWQEKVARAGLLFHTPANGAGEPTPYWDESAYYQFSSREVDVLEKATNDLQTMCLAAGQFIIDKNRFADLDIPASAVPAIRQTWEEEPPAIYGRFDLAYDGSGPPKLLEYNADTPTSLVEAAVIQWEWLEDCFPGSDQFNSIHERLIAKWKELRDYTASPVYFAALDDMEDIITVTYMEDTAQQAGLKTKRILIPDIGWDSAKNCFVDLDEKVIKTCFKLYPWEMMLKDEFGSHSIETTGKVQWMEPIWKMMFSNKGLLAILWEMYPGHANLLEAHLNGPEEMSEYVQKPLLGREGANITLKTVRGDTSTPGPYGDGRYVYQAVAPIPQMSSRHPVIGSWVIDGEAAGMGIRESSGMITDNLSRFVPHRFE